MLQVHYLTLNPFSQNTYILFNHHNNAIIIDPGNFFAEEDEQLFSFITANNLTVKHILNTHCHLDHIFGLEKTCIKYNLSTHFHKNEELMLQFAPQSAARFGIQIQPINCNYNFINENDVIKLDEDELHVIECFGHSPGHLCFYNKEQHFLIGGDVLFYESIGRTDLPMCNHDDLINNIKSKIFTLPNETIVYSGHGHQTTIEHEKIFNPFVK